MLLRGCATPPRVQQQNFCSASTQKGVGILKKGIKVQTLIFNLTCFLFFTLLHQSGTPSLYAVDNVVRMFIFEMKRYNFWLD